MFTAVIGLSTDVDSCCLSFAELWGLQEWLNLSPWSALSSLPLWMAAYSRKSSHETSAVSCPFASAPRAFLGPFLSCCVPPRPPADQVLTATLQRHILPASSALGLRWFRCCSFLAGLCWFSRAWLSSVKRLSVPFLFCSDSLTGQSLGLKAACQKV